MRTKALEWVKHPHANLWRADCLTGRYQVYAITSPITWGFDGFDGLTEVFGESPTEEAAKAAAQSHFDAAIASVLEDDWQTMETAPKDRWIEAWRPPSTSGFWQSRVCVRWYDDGVEFGERGWVWPDREHDPSTPVGEEHAEEQIEKGNFYIDRASFTHWRLLPSPPKAGE